MELFEVVADALRGMVPPELGQLHSRAHRYGIKVWFESDKPSREHYEAQVIGAKDVPDAEVLAIEIGFHSEHPNPAENESILKGLVRVESTWRKQLGKEPTAGAFLGRRDDWTRISETWPDPDLGDEELAVELAARLTDYVTALEPLRRPGVG